MDYKDTNPNLKPTPDNDVQSDTTNSTEHGSKPEIGLPNPSIATPSIPAEMPAIEGR